MHSTWRVECTEYRARQRCWRTKARQSENVGSSLWYQHDHPALHTGQGQQHGGKAAIDDQHQPALWQPAAHLLHHLPDPIHAGLMPSCAALRRGPAECCQKVERPDPPAPGHRHQEHHGHPLQAKAANDVLFGGAHRIPVATLGHDLAAAAAFHGVVRPEHDRRSRRHQQRDEQA
jgi:hypothetical protein